MLPTTNKKFKVTIEFEISGDVADLVTEEHITDNIQCGIEQEDLTFGEATDEIELWGEAYGDYEDVWYLYRRSDKSNIKVVEIDQFEHEREEEEEFIDGMEKLVNGPNAGKQKPNKLYKIYHDDGDTELYVTPNGDIFNRFLFQGFSNGIHPYFQKKMDLVYEIMASVGIIVNHKTVDKISDMHVPSAKNMGYFDVEDILVPRNLKVSENGKMYYHLQDQEMGRGWAVLMEIDPETDHGEFIQQDHRDNVRDWMFYDWITQVGADVEFIGVENVEEFLKKKKES